MQELPEYMRPIYATILDTTNEWSQHVLKVEGWDPLPWLKTAVRFGLVNYCGFRFYFVFE
jgi:hypothetical protein